MNTNLDVKAQLDKGINDAVEAYSHNLPDILETIIQTTHREFMSLGFDEKIFAKMTKEIVENMLAESGYNEDEIIDILNT